MVDNNERIFYNKLRQSGYTHEQALGVLGNLYHESGGGKGINTGSFNPNDRGKSSFGAAQWRAERQTALRNFANKEGKSPTDPNLQADFLVWELNNSHKTAGFKLKNAKTVEDATRVFVDDFERPHHTARFLDRRINYAYSANNKLGDLSQASYSNPSQKVYYDSMGNQSRPIIDPNTGLLTYNNITYNPSDDTDKLISSFSNLLEDNIKSEMIKEERRQNKIKTDAIKQSLIDKTNKRNEALSILAATQVRTVQPDGKLTEASSFNPSTYEIANNLQYKSDLNNINQQYQNQQGSNNILVDNVVVDSENNYIA